MSRSFTENWYRLFLRTFPPSHRTEYREEMLGILMADSTRRAPSARETAGLLTAGLATRVRAATTKPWWPDGLQLGLLTLALANLAHNIADHASPWWLAASTMLVAALLRGWALAALPLALAVTFTTARVMLLGPEATTWPPQFFGPAYHNWVSLAPYGVLAIGAAILAANQSRRPEKLRARLAIPAAALVLTYLPRIHEYGQTWQIARAGTECIILFAGVLATAITRSPRWPLAAAIYVLPNAAGQPTSERPGHRLLVNTHRTPTSDNRNSLAPPPPPQATPPIVIAHRRRTAPSISSLRILARQ